MFPTTYRDIFTKKQYFFLTFNKKDAFFLTTDAESFFWYLIHMLS